MSGTRFDMDDEHTEDWVVPGAPHTEREDVTSIHTLAGLRLSSDKNSTEMNVLKSHAEPLAVNGIDRKTGFSYVSVPDQGVFASKKGQMLQTTKSAKFNGSIKTLDQSGALLTDAELINVLRFDTKIINVKPQATAKKYPAEFVKVPLLFDEHDRGINAKLKMVTGPALGYVYAIGEASKAKAAGDAKLKQLRKYRNGMAPLKKLSMIEDELDHVVHMKGHKLSNTYIPHLSRRGNPNEIPVDHTRHLTHAQFEAIRRQIYGDSTTQQHDDGTYQDGVSRGGLYIENIEAIRDAVGLEEELGTGSTFRPNASITITVPNSDTSASDFLKDSEQNLSLTERNTHRGDNDHIEEDEEVMFSLADFGTPRSPQPDELEERKRKERAERVRKKLEGVIVKERKGLRSVRKDPCLLADQLPRSKTGEYLVKDFALGKNNHMFEFQKDTDLLGGEEAAGAVTGEYQYRPSFQHTKEKLKSKKDKVFLKGPEESSSEEVLEGVCVEELAGSAACDVSVGGHSSRGLEQEPMPPMASRYSTGQLTLTEKPLTGKNHEIPGFIKTLTIKKTEIKNRLTCVVCRLDALFWCPECAQNFCERCWNSIGHHETTTPDEVWNNRKPDHAIEYHPNDEVGMSVFLAPHEICQGRLRREHTPLLGTSRPRSPGLQSIEFPPPGGVSVDANGGRSAWQTTRGKRKGGARSGARLGGLAGTAPRQSGQDLLKVLVAPSSKHLLLAPPPCVSPSLSPVSSPASKRATATATATPASSPPPKKDHLSPNGSFSNASKNTFSPPKEDVAVAPVPPAPVRPPPVVMDPVTNQKLMWQVTSSGHSLCPVSSLTPGKYMQPARGITSEYFPDEWKKGRKDIHRQLRIYNGVTVATRKDPVPSSAKVIVAVTTTTSETAPPV